MREMKDSGIEWIGQIPSDWICCKQKYMIRLINGRAYSDNEFEVDGKYRILRVGNLFSNPVWYTSSLELSNDKYCEEGDLLYSWSMSYSPVIWHGEKVIYHYHIWKTNLSSMINKMFAFYYLVALTDALRAEIHETTMGFVTMGIMNNSYIVFPNIHEQKLIVDFLDAKCSEIDALTADIEKQIETLEAYKKSVITETLFEDHNAYTQLKHIGDFQNGINFISKDAETEVPFLCVGDFQNNMVLSGRNAFSSIMYDGTVPSTALLKNNDIVFVRSNGSKSLVGRSVLIKSVDFPLTYSGFCIRFRNKRKEYDSKYIMYALWSDKFRETIDEFTRGTNITNVSQDMLKKVLVPERTLTEQIIIIHLLDQKCAEIDQAINLKRKQLDVLADYKKSLIYEYVTGKKEVF